MALLAEQTDLPSGFAPPLPSIHSPRAERLKSVLTKKEQGASFRLLVSASCRQLRRIDDRAVLTKDCLGNERVLDGMLAHDADVSHRVTELR